MRSNECTVTGCSRYWHYVLARFGAYLLRPIYIEYLYVVFVCKYLCVFYIYIGRSRYSNIVLDISKEAGSYGTTVSMPVPNKYTSLLVHTDKACTQCTQSCQCTLNESPKTLRRCLHNYAGGLCARSPQAGASTQPTSSTRNGTWPRRNSMASSRSVSSSRSLRYAHPPGAHQRLVSCVQAIVVRPRMMVSTRCKVSGAQERHQSLLL